MMHKNSLKQNYGTKQKLKQISTSEKNRVNFISYFSTYISLSYSAVFFYCFVYKDHNLQ